jgi:glycolate oxidase iron-sulfur subunit
VELLELEGSTICCGSAGIYSAVQQELAGRILEHKLDHLEETGAQQVVTANPGCMAQLVGGVRRRGLSIDVAHVVDLLDEAYRAEEEDSPAVLR